MVKMRERIEFIDRCLSWNWRLQQKSESWQANVNKEFKMKYLDVSRDKQRILVEIQGPVILELQAVSLVLKFGEGRWLEQEKAEEDPGVSESGLALREERGADCMHWGTLGWVLGSEAIIMIGAWTLRITQCWTWLRYMESCVPFCWKFSCKWFSVNTRKDD